MKTLSFLAPSLAVVSLLGATVGCKSSSTGAGGTTSTTGTSSTKSSTTGTSTVTSSTSTGSSGTCQAACAKNAQLSMQLSCAPANGCTLSCMNEVGDPTCGAKWAAAIDCSTTNASTTTCKCDAMANNLLNCDVSTPCTTQLQALKACLPSPTTSASTTAAGGG